MTGPGTGTDDPIDLRMTAVLTVAARYQTEVEVTDLAALLPEDGPAEPLDIVRWVRDHPQTGFIYGETVRPPGSSPRTAEDVRIRRTRGLDYLTAARQLFAGPLAPLSADIQCACVTGSTAYQEPMAGDDVDLMIVTKPGAMWLTLLRVFLVLRRERRSGVSTARPWCVNYVLDEREARRTYGVSRGFLFAREALTAKPVVGGDYYAALIRHSAWMRDELPRMYQRWNAEAGPDPLVSSSSAWVRLANAVAFPLMATYLQLVGLWRNHGLRRAGRADEGFRTRTTAGHYALQTMKFDRLHRIVEPASRTARTELPV